MENALQNPAPAAVAAPDDLAGWQAIQADIEERAQPACQRAIDLHQPTLDERSFSGMGATLIHPGGDASNKSPVIFLHGGAYIGFSACSSLFASIPLAVKLQRRLIALDYPLAPASRFDRTVPTTAKAIAAAMGEFGPCSLVGDSAGGGLAVAAVNYLLQRDPPNASALPTALVLVSPWTDLSPNGDSRTTLHEHDPLLDVDHLGQCAETYAGEDLRNPMASPVYAEYSGSFPPTLIVCGSREILLSDAVRLHQHLDQAGVNSRLLVQDGLHHSFLTVTPNTPEARASKQRIARFLDQCS